MRKRDKNETILILHNIRSAHNVGSIFRTADAADVSKILLTGYTPAPLDRFGRPRSDVAKAALGAERTVPWEAHRTIARTIARLKKDGARVVAVEQDARAQAYRSFRAKGKTVFIFGNEVRGLPKSVLASADAVIEIPMRGSKESLNVAVAAGIVLFRCF